MFSIYWTMTQWYWEKQSRNYLGKLEFLISVAHHNEKDISRIFSSLFLEENSAHHTKATCQRKRLVELTVSEGASVMAGAIAGSSRHGCRGWCLRTLIPNYKHKVEKERTVRWVRQCPPTITHFLQQPFYQGWPSIQTPKHREDTSHSNHPYKLFIPAFPVALTPFPNISPSNFKSFIIFQPLRLTNAFYMYFSVRVSIGTISTVIPLSKENIYFLTAISCQ